MNRLENCQALNNLLGLPVVAEYDLDENMFVCKVKVFSSHKNEIVPIGRNMKTMVYEIIQREFKWNGIN